MTRACACAARLSSATLRAAICSRRVCKLPNEEEAAAGGGDARAMYTVSLSPSLLVSLRLVLSSRLLRCSALVPLLVSVAVFVNAIGTACMRSGEGGGGGGGRSCVSGSSLGTVLDSASYSGGGVVCTVGVAFP